MPPNPDQQERLAAAAEVLAAAARRSGSSAPPPTDLRQHDTEPEPREVARRIVLRLLASSPKSRSQLEEALRKRNCPDDVAAEVLDRMKELGLVDDVAFAEMLVRSQQSARGLARRALAYELRKRGVDDETVSATLADIDPGAERDRARKLVDRKLRTLHGLDATVQARRLAGMLARKGYSTEIMMAVVREAVADAPEHQRD